MRAPLSSHPFMGPTSQTSHYCERRCKRSESGRCQYRVQRDGHALRRDAWKSVVCKAMQQALQNFGAVSINHAQHRCVKCVWRDRGFRTTIESLGNGDESMSNQTLELSGKRAGWPESLPDPRTTHPDIWASMRHRMVSDAAYYRSGHRQPCGGRELEDWLAAEREVEEYLRDPRD
jgi:hypothetical protein